MNTQGRKGVYFPYFRGKQFELILLREQQSLLARSSFVPVIEPVTDSLNSVKKTLQSLLKSETMVSLIINPANGDLKNDGSQVEHMVDEDKYVESDCFYVGYIINSTTTIDQIRAILAKYTQVMLIHNGFAQGRELSTIIDASGCNVTNLFIENQSPRLYRNHYKRNKILNRDGFKKCFLNKDYPDFESFSDLHCTYVDEGLDGFSDFLINGSEYVEAGGPASTVTIHLTFIDPELDNQMFIYHFKSDRTEGISDPGGKFLEALSKLVNVVSLDNSKILKTEAVKEYLQLFEQEHFPGLGYVKKLSMQHHLETLSDFLGPKD